MKGKYISLLVSMNRRTGPPFQEKEKRWCGNLYDRRVLLLFSLLALIIQGCATPHRLPAVPQEITTRAVIPGIPRARYWVGGDIEPLMQEGLASFKRERELLAKSGHLDRLPPAQYLAISGGGDMGAFGAGLLNGWTETGTRPEFKLVTGISTGALIAPFAFLGPDHDDTLKEVYTMISPKNIYERRNIIAALFNDGLSDNAPLFRLIQGRITEELLREIAEEYRKGRLLLIGTTNLDVLRPVVWNIGAIAASGDPSALELVRNILLASAAIPGVFPPVMIDVEVNGHTYQEMHVDGGAAAEVFLFPPTLLATARAHGVDTQRERKLFIIRNARLDPEWAAVERRTMSIAGRAVTSLIQTQGLGDLYRLYVTAERDGMDYNLAFVGQEFKAQHKEDFDTQFMRALFNYGYELGRKGYVWHKTPPGLER